MADKLKQIQVQGTDDNNKVVIWERHVDHPDGEVLVSNNGKVHTVAETPRVKTLIAEGRLTTEVDEEKTPTSTTRTTEDGRRTSTTQTDTATTPKKG